MHGRLEVAKAIASLAPALLVATVSPDADAESSSSETSMLTGEAPGHHGGPFETTAVLLKPADDRQTTGYGATVGVDLIDVLGRGALGYAYDFAGSIGADTARRFLYDASVSVGLGVSLPHVQIIPLVGVGVDGGSGADDGDFNLHGAGYWEVGGRLRLGLGKLAFEVGFDRVTRGSFFGGPRAPIGRENRFQLKYVIAGKIHPYLGVRYIDYQGSVSSAGALTTGAAGIGLMFGFKI